MLLFSFSMVNLYSIFHPDKYSMCNKPPHVFVYLRMCVYVCVCILYSLLCTYIASKKNLTSDVSYYVKLESQFWEFYIQNLALCQSGLNFEYSDTKYKQNITKYKWKKRKKKQQPNNQWKVYFIERLLSWIEPT